MTSPLHFGSVQCSVMEVAVVVEVMCGGADGVDGGVVMIECGEKGPIPAALLADTLMA